MVLLRLFFAVATLLGLVWSQQADNSTNGANQAFENPLIVKNRTIVDAVNHLTQLNVSYPVGRKINFSPSRTEDSTPQSGTGLRVKFPPRTFKARPNATHRSRNESSPSPKKIMYDFKNLHPQLARKLVNATREESEDTTKELENRSEVDATINELIGEKLARLEKMLVDELLLAYNNISKEVKSRRANGEQKVTSKPPFRIVVSPLNGAEKKESTIKRSKIFESPLNTTHVMRITKNNINEGKIKKMNETEITQDFQDFGKKITQKRESVENDLEAAENARKFNPSITYLSGFRPIVRRDLSVVGPIPRGFGGMRSFDSTYDGIHSGDIMPPIWPAPPFSMPMAAVEQQPQRVKVNETPSLELLLYKYEEALKQYQEAVSSYKKYYDKYLMYN